MDIKTLVAESHQTALEKGWYDIPSEIKAILSERSPRLSESWDRYFLNSCLMNVASEIGEACEAVRDGDCVHPSSRHMRSLRSGFGIGYRSEDGEEQVAPVYAREEVVGGNT